MEKVSRLRILFVDDSEAVCYYYKKYLLSAGYETVYVAGGGHEALSILQQYSEINVVILDMLMPGMDGLQLTKEIKGRWPHVEVIMLTGFVDFELAVDVIKAGAYDYLHQPVDEGRLAMVLQRCRMKIESDGLIAQLSGKIFLSYAREDKGTVKEVYGKLQGLGFNPWMDLYDIKPGEKWQLRIEEVIRESSFFLALLSRSSVNKRGMIQKEMKAGYEAWSQYLESDIYLIPVRLEECFVPAPLDKIQWVDVYLENGWDMLIAGIREGLARRRKNRI